MDPNLFHIDYERTFEALVTIVVLSMFIERALAVVFESRIFIRIYEANDKRKGLKEIIALAVSIAVCIIWQFDALSVIVLSHSENQMVGYFITGAIIAGGAKGSVALFTDVFGFMSHAEAERREKRKKAR